MEWCITGGLLVLSALFSGLNLGLMSLGPHDLKRKIALYNDQRAVKVYSVRKNGNLLLVTLLLGNVAVNTVLSVFLASLMTGILAVVLSTLLITILGEIVPQAVLSRHALAIGAKTVWIVKIFLFLLYPIAKPISYVLDKTLGEELPTMFSKKELISILEEHSTRRESDVNAHEERIAHGALTYGAKPVKDVMTPRSSVMFLGAEQELAGATLRSVVDDGHDRYPVHGASIDEIVGVLYVRDIIGNEGKTAGAIAKKPVYFIHEEQLLDEALSLFIKSRHHILIVANSFEEVVGVLTLEDILEEILSAEIVDEFDKYVDMRAVAKAHKRAQ